MDLGIAGRKAIICASSRGLGKGCAEALAEAGCDLVINGRDVHVLEATAADLAKRFGVTVTPVVADVSTPEGQATLLAACPDPDILVNNNGGPPRKDYDQLDRAAMIAGVVGNMITPIELIQKVIGPMSERGFGRIVNITSSSVKAPISGLDLSSGARAGLTAFLGGVARDVAQKGVTINHLLPGKFDTDRLVGGFARAAKEAGVSVEEAKRREIAAIPAGRLGTPEEFGRVCAFLCSVHAAYITGQSFLLDGGLIRTNF